MGPASQLNAPPAPLRLAAPQVLIRPPYAPLQLAGRMGGGQEQQRAKLLSEEQAVSQGNAAAAGTAAATGGQHEAQQASLHATEGEQQQPKKKKAGSSAQQSDKPPRPDAVDEPQQATSEQEQQPAAEQPAAEQPAAASQQAEQQGQAEAEESGQTDMGWAGSFLHKKADAAMTQVVDETSLVSPQARCRVAFSFNLTAAETEQLALGQAAAEGQNTGLLTGVALQLPCKCVGLRAGLWAGPGVGLHVQPSCMRACRLLECKQAVASPTSVIRPPHRSNPLHLSYLAGRGRARAAARAAPARCTSARTQQTTRSSSRFSSATTCGERAALRAHARSRVP